MIRNSNVGVARQLGGASGHLSLRGGRRTQGALAVAALLMTGLSGCSIRTVSDELAAKYVPTVIESQSSAFDDIVPANVTLKIIYQEFDGFFEGPSWVGGLHGFLVFSDIPGNRVLKVSRSDQVSVLADHVQAFPVKDALHDTLYTLRDLVGPNGTSPNGPRQLLMAMFGGGSVMVLDLKTSKQLIVAASEASMPLHLPNDVVVSQGGDVYFSAHGGIYRIHGGRLGLFIELDANGLAFSPDGGSLYATDGPDVIRKIAVQTDGSAGQVTLFLETHGDPAKDEFLDGLKVDRDGNVWAVAPGGIWVVSPAGSVLGRIAAPEVAMPTGKHRRFTNLAFGGNGGDTLYLTAPGGVYSLRLNRPMALAQHVTP
jgi:gluconolactonase